MDYKKSIVLRLHLTSICNLNCRYCYEDKNMKKGFMSLNNFKKIMSFYSSYNISKLYLYGGEPLLNKEIMDYIVSKKKLPGNIKQISMTTNATLLRKSYIKFFDNNNSQINISIDGIKSSHNRNRLFLSGKGSFDKIMLNIKEINDFSKYIISMTLSPEIIKNFTNSLIYLKKIGFNNFGINFLYEKIWNKENILILIKQLIQIKKLNLITKDSFTNELNYGSGITCEEHMRNSISIGPNLEILPCGYWWSKNIRNNKKIKIYKLGYLFDKRFDYNKMISTKIIKNQYLGKIMSKGRICEMLLGRNFLNNKKKIYYIIKSVFN